MLTSIRASAGSGKTYALTRHFLALLQKASPSPVHSGCALHGDTGAYSLAGILAATFTNKAAAEMKNRVIAALKEETLRARARGERCTAEAWVERILRHYGSLNIRTIDSLLNALVRLSALELRLPPDFEPSFDPGEFFTPLYDALMTDLADAALPDDAFAAPPALEPFAPGETPPPFSAPGPGEASQPETPQDHALFLTEDPAVLRASLVRACHVLLHFGDASGFSPKNRLHDLLLELVTRLLRDEPVPVMDSERIYRRLNALHAEVVASCGAMLDHIAAEALQAKAQYLRFLNNCAGSLRYRPLPSSVYREKDCLDACLNKSSLGAASAGAHAAFARAAKAVNAYARDLPLYRHALQLAPLTVLAHELHARLRERQHATGLLPAPRLPLLAGTVLTGGAGVSDALCRLGTRLSRLLLDEFQDTSREQWAAIHPLVMESLSTGGSLTYVGDVKQAIYGWRGGDARLFEEASADPEIRAVIPTPVKETLPYNWRSHPAIVEHNNAFFSLLADPAVAKAVLAAMLPQATPAHYQNRAAEEAGRIFTGAAQAIPPQKTWAENANGHKAQVRLYTAEGANSAAVLALVKGRMRALFLEELLPHWQYGDIAVLVRSGEEAALAADWLTQWGLPVVTENSFLLASHPLVGRLISFLAFLDYPLDDLAFWEFVSGPECLGESEEADFSSLTDWLASLTLRHGAQRPPLYQVFRRDFPAIWERWIAPFHTGAGLMSAYDTLAEAIRRFCLLERMPKQAPFLRRLMELAHLAESRGHSSLAAFLAFWRDCRENERLPLPENMNAVRIMTIHKAKGLEFPVVVLPFQHRGRRRTPELVALTVKGLPLLTRAVKELEDQYYPACITDELERLNLLYVAWTRPVYALHAFITRPRTAVTPLTRALELLVEAYKNKTGGTLCQWESLGETQPRKDGPCPAPGIPPAVRPPAPSADLPWRPMAWLPRLRIFRTPLPEPHFTPRQRGILAHLCLEQLVLSAGQEPEQLRRDVAWAVRQGMRLFPLPLDDPERIAHEMEAALAWFAALHEAPHWLEHGLREQDIMDANGRMHRVDLLVQAPPGSGGQDAAFLCAIDYKTGRPHEDHMEQVRRYMRLSAAATGRPLRGLLVYLDERLLLPVEAEKGALP